MAETQDVYLLPVSLEAHPPPCPLSLPPKAPYPTCNCPVVEGSSSRTRLVLPLKVVNDPPQTGCPGLMPPFFTRLGASYVICALIPVRQLGSEKFDPILQRRGQRLGEVVLVLVHSSKACSADKQSGPRGRCPGVADFCSASGRPDSHGSQRQNGVPRWQ